MALLILGDLDPYPRTITRRAPALPDVPRAAYPGMDEQFMEEIRRSRWRMFFDQYFTANFEAKAALGAIRHLDQELAAILDSMTSWRLDTEQMGNIRTALRRIEERHR